MEKQRSFSIKPTRFLVFSFTISVSTLFLLIFSLWVIKIPPSFHQETRLQFDGPSGSPGRLAPFIVHTLAGLKDSLPRSGLTNTISPGIRAPSEGNEDEVNAGRGAGSSLNAAIDLRGKFSELDLNDSAPLPSPQNESTVAPGFTTDSQEEEDEAQEGDDAGTSETEVTDDLARENRSINGGVQQGSHKPEVANSLSVGRIADMNGRACDVTKGNWVFDDSYPLYRNTCLFIDEGFNCQANGRLDKEYMKWRWQPQECDIPRFNATKFLEIIRGKRLVFAGDSINRNQWESLLCLLTGAIKDPKKVYEVRGRRITKEKGNYAFRFVDYKCTVEYHVSHFLVHESKARIGKKRVQTLRIDTIDKGSSKWRGADILVFNTAHWWTHHKTKAGINYYQEGDVVHPRLDVATAFQRALTTWASWVNRYVQPGNTQVFFRSSSPSHFSGGDWNTGGHCKDTSQPLNDTYIVNYPQKNLIVDEVVRHMKTPVILLNITNLSAYRIDGHPSVYGKKTGKSNSGVQDCSHWCLPGVPDIWNEILLYHLLLGRQENLVV